MSIMNQGKRPEKHDTAVLKKLLGSLELEIMEGMWQLREATVQEVVKCINRKRPIAYTSVMTVMSHLVDKGLLSRTMVGTKYIYQVAQSKGEFLRTASKKMIRTLVNDFGDVAIAQFLGEVDNMDVGKLTQLRKLVQEADSENSAAE